MFFSREKGLFLANRTDSLHLLHRVTKGRTPSSSRGRRSSESRTSRIQLGAPQTCWWRGKPCRCRGQRPKWRLIEQRIDATRLLPRGFKRNLAATSSSNSMVPRSGGWQNLPVFKRSTRPKETTAWLYVKKCADGSLFTVTHTRKRDRTPSLDSSTVDMDTLVRGLQADLSSNLSEVPEPDVATSSTPRGTQMPVISGNARWHLNPLRRGIPIAYCASPMVFQ